MNRLKDALSRIKGADESAMLAARQRQDYLAKVPGSLGVLEEISIRLAGITGLPFGNKANDQAIIIMCADNGIVEEGVASAPQSVTLMQTINITKRITGVGSQADYFNMDLLVVDVGVKQEIPKEFLADEMLSSDTKIESRVVNRRISNGTKNFAKEPAMTREEAIRAIMIGIDAVEQCKLAGKNLIGVGEMGIGNTTTASAIIAAFAEINHQNIKPGALDEASMEETIENIVGRGGGLSDQGLKKKKAVIKDALVKYAPLYITEDGIDEIELLRTVGGFDIAGMVGAYLGAAIHRIPVVIDGVISIAAAILAVSICPEVKDFMFTSHKSKEGGYLVASELLGIPPLFDLEMRLGEGSGCPIAFKIIEAATAVMNGMKTLDEAQVDAAYLDEFRDDGQFR